MNKASAKEPSMDEILSSIRQIIADDDSKFSSPAAASAPAATDDEGDPIVALNEGLMAAQQDAGEDVAEDDPLALSADQIVEDDLDAAMAVPEETGFDMSEIVEPDDISFDEDDEAVTGGLQGFEMPDEPEPQKASASVEMPDPALSEDIANRLLEPATDAAVKSTFSKLSNLSLGSQSVTIENMVREMLRPMLKEWLDENLPSVVEKMVEKEIERISRGG